MNCLAWFSEHFGKSFISTVKIGREKRDREKSAASCVESVNFYCSVVVIFLNEKIINSKNYDLQVLNFQSRKLTILNSKIPKLPQSKKFKFTNLKILNSETSHLQVLNS